MGWKKLVDFEATGSSLHMQSGIDVIDLAVIQGL